MKTEKFIAKPGVEDARILYTYQLGGGLKGRTVKAGEEVTRVVHAHWHEDYYGVAVLETVHRISLDGFNKYFEPAHAGRYDFTTNPLKK